MKTFGKIFGVIVAALVLTACGRIETGQVGVRKTFNKTVLMEEERVGFYWAIFEEVDEYVIKETELQFDNFKPKAKDNLILQDLDVSIFYTVKPDAVAELSVKYTGQSYPVEGKNWWYPAQGVVMRFGRGSIYDSVAKFDSLTLHTNRAALEAEIMKSTQSDLDKSDPGVFVITKVIVRQALTDETLEASIRRTVEFDKKIEAKEKEKLLAQKEAERLVIEANGQALANKIIADSLDDKLLKLKQIEAQAVFATQGTHTVLLPQGQTVIPSIGK